MAGRQSLQAKATPRSGELGDIEKAIDRMTFGVASSAAVEPLVAPVFRRVLVALDGSPGSRAALAWAAELGKRLKAHVTVVSVAPSPQAARALRANTMTWDVVGVAFGEAEEEAAKVLKQADEYLRTAGILHSVELQQGTAAKCIVEMAESDRSDLLILGSHGHGFGERLNLGSVGSTAKHHVACSVLVARRPPPAKHLLLATDGSQRSHIAARVGLDLAGALGARTTLAHVIDMGSYGVREHPGLLRGKLLAVQERLEESPGYLAGQTMVVAGQPAQELRKLATSIKADLIVVGSRGLGGLRSLTLGSLSDKLSHKADQSILVVKPQPK